MDVVRLQERLVNNKDDIIKILLKLGFDEDKVKYSERDNRISCVRPEVGADNENGFVLYLNNLHWFYTTRSGSGNIFTLVMDLKKLSFPQSLRAITNWLGIKENNIHIRLPFLGFYKNIERQRKNPEIGMKEYDEESVGGDGLSQKFFLDGIDFKTQEYFDIRYDHENDAILIPIHDYEGRLVGCKARNNNPNCDMSQRWWAKLPYTKSFILYGYIENYTHIVTKRTVIIFEAEKSVMQCHSFGCYIALAIGGHSISEVQARYIKSLLCENIIIAFDEGIDEEEIQYEANKLISNVIVKNNVYYIYDGNNEILKKGSKDSPSDNGIDAFKKLLNKRVKLNGSERRRSEISRNQK